MSRQKNDAPPSYDFATLPGAQEAPQPGALRVPGDGHTTDGSTEGEDEDIIPRDERISMMEDSRELPEGWLRMFDPSNSNHAFYVDTKANPPRSIWTHPYDDLDYLKSLPESSEVRQHYIQQYREAKEQEQESSATADSKKKYEPPSEPPPARSSGMGPTGTSASGAASDSKDERSLGRKLKDKMTGSTHDQRVRERRAQQELELKQYQQFIMKRKQLIEQQQRNPRYAPPMVGYPGSSRGYRTGGYGYGNGGMYGGRGYGMGGGLGYGAMGMGGGLLGGMLIGNAMGGGFGGGGFDGGMGGGGGMGC